MKDISALLQLIVDNIPASVFWKDLDSRYLGANNHFIKAAGLNNSEEIIGKTDFDLAWSNEEAEAFRKDDKEVTTTRTPKTGIIEPARQADGVTHWLETNKLPLIDNSGDVVGLLGFFRDVTEDHQEKIELEKIALFDALTGIPNRRFVENLVKSSKYAPSKYCGLMFIDLDYFKTINDTLGHEVGDHLLTKVAIAIRDAVGARGTTGRLGGDEFAVIVNRPDNSVTIENHLKEISNDILQCFGQPFYIAEHILYLDVSIGATLAQRDGQLSFKEADLALHETKSTSGKDYSIFSNEMKKKVEAESALLLNLRKAIDQQEFHLNYQPIFNTNEECVGAEALMRWRQPDSGLISPELFIPLAEKAGLIHPLGGWLLDECQQTQNERFTAKKNNWLSINISPVQFIQKNFEDLICEQLLSTGLPASLFELEVTESLLLGNQDLAIKKLQSLRDKGFSIAIDDFGTGYSSLNYLFRLPVDKLKIDRSFVNQIYNDDKSRIVVEMILKMAKNLNIKTVAEGVESRRELDFLKVHHCDFYQGYYFSKPIAKADYCKNY